MWSFGHSNVQIVPAYAAGTWLINDLEPFLLCHSSAEFALHNLIAQAQSISVNYNSVNSCSGNSSLHHGAEHLMNTEIEQEYLTQAL